MKTYISKSNQANPDDLLALRALLKDDEVLEYKGGPYDPTATHEADRIIVLPPKQPEQRPSNAFYLGRGVYGEMKSCEGERFIFYDNQAYKYLESKVLKEDWQVKYALVMAEPATL